METFGYSDASEGLRVPFTCFGSNGELRDFPAMLSKASTVLFLLD